MEESTKSHLLVLQIVIVRCPRETKSLVKAMQVAICEKNQVKMMFRMLIFYISFVYLLS